MVRRELAASSASRAAGPLIEGDRRLRQMVAEHEVAQETAMLKLRPIGPHDYSVLEDSQRIGRIRLADERMPPVLALERHHPSDRWTADGFGQGP
jgi:hypothetical protein